MIIAIEGIDGSGKGTQSRLLADYLSRTGLEPEFIQFPRYSHTKFGAEVGRYLNGEYGTLDQVPPKLAAMLYALDRFETLPLIKSAVSNGRIVICDRYVGSNLAHQSAKLRGGRRQELIEWIKDLEYHVLGIPQPDLVFFLDMSTDNAKSLIGKKDVRTYTDKVEDLHEQSSDHLTNALQVFRELSARFGWVHIQCVQETGQIKSPGMIHEEILSIIRTKKII